MKERIELVVKHSGLSKAKFAERIGVSAPYVTMLCSGAGKPSDRTISDICREFSVDRIWLETGVGEPFRPIDRDEQIAAILTKAITGNVSARDRLIRAFCQLPDEMFDHAEAILQEIIDNLQKEKTE